VLYLPRLCYDTTNQKFNAPILTAHFEGADVLLTRVSFSALQCILLTRMIMMDLEYMETLLNQIS